MKEKTLKFAEKLIPSILNKNKNETWRAFDDKNISKGDVINMINASTGKVFGKALITNVKGEKSKDISKKTLKAYGYKNRKEMIQSHKKYYGNKVNENSIIKIIKFKLLNHNH